MARKCRAPGTFFTSTNPDKAHPLVLAILVTPLHRVPEDPSGTVFESPKLSLSNYMHFFTHIAFLPSSFAVTMYIRSLLVWCLGASDAPLLLGQIHTAQLIVHLF